MTVLAAGLMAVSFAGCNSDFFTQLQTNSKDEGTKYTVLLYTFFGPRHIEQSKSLKAATEKHAGWRDLFIVHEENISRLFWGKYSSINTAVARRKKAQKWRTPTKMRVYQGALEMELPGGRQVGPPKWDLTKTNKAYSVVVAVFYNVPEARYVGRKEFAVKYCKQLRDKGEQAYYYHGVTESAVTIGAFDETAIEEVRKGSLSKHVIRDRRINSIMERYPKLAVNGREERVVVPDIKTAKASWIDRISHPIRIPSKKGTDGVKPVHRPGHTQQRQDPRDSASTQEASDLDRIRERIWGH